MTRPLAQRKQVDTFKGKKGLGQRMCQCMVSCICGRERKYKSNSCRETVRDVHRKRGLSCVNQLRKGISSVETYFRATMCYISSGCGPYLKISAVTLQVCRPETSWIAVRVSWKRCVNKAVQNKRVLRLNERVPKRGSLALPTPSESLPKEWHHLNLAP